MISASDLLAGPRGRRLCWTVLWLGLADDVSSSAAWVLAWTGVTAGDLSGSCLDALAAVVAAADPAALAAGESTVLEALAWTADTATYWQEPDAEDQALAASAACDVLRPVADAIAAAPVSRWWDSPLDPERQRYAQFLGDQEFNEPQLSGAVERLAAWRADIVGREASLPAPGAEPLGAWSGHWWSDPAMSGLPITTRALPGIGALRLAVVEDGLGWKSARCWPLRPRTGARIYEIDGPDAWASLVARYPLDVTRSRRHDWWRATGWTGRWLIPDYQAAAEDYDAVHVSVLGYLTTAGVTIAVPPGSDGFSGSADVARTLLAGWEPDAAWWLTDSLSPTGPPEDWKADDGARTGWRLTGPSSG